MLNGSRTGTNEASTLEDMIVTCLNSKCCGFECSQDTVCEEDKMPGKDLIESIRMKEELCCVDKYNCDHPGVAESILTECTYTAKSRKRATPKNEFFELGDWKENCCEDGIKCSDVTGLNSEFCNKY